MKKIKIFLLAFLTLFFWSCQKEENSIDTKPTNVKNLDSKSQLASLISRVSQNPTSCDNVIDNCSCFSVLLPVTVTVNAVQIVVNTKADYQLVQNAKDAYNNDNDIVSFNYPITIKYKNFQNVVIPNVNKFDDAKQACDYDYEFNEIECLKINYPIKINIYNTNNQIANTITIQSNSQLFNFLKNLSSSDLIAINYPISVTNQNNQVVTINDNFQLQDIIENAIPSCSINGSGNSSLFSTVIKSGTWRITYLYDDNFDKTSYYNGYNFTFNANGTSVALNNSSPTNGTWSTYLDSGLTILVLGFDGANLKLIEEDWKVIEFTQTTIRLRHGGGSNPDYLYLTKN
jgi:hypothetical protein